jgi:hypothetical protein
MTFVEQVAILPNLAFDDERRRNLAEDDYRREITFSCKILSFK